MRRAILVIVVLAVAAVGGASQSAAKPAPSQPVVALKEVKMTNTAFDGGTLDVLLSVYNPNSYDLDISQMTYSVIVDSTEIGIGHSAQRVLIKAGGSAMVHLPLDFTWAHAASAGRLLTMSGAVPYEVKGSIQALIPKVGPASIPFDQHGQFRSLNQSR
jgi:LEA14-like dessication related protein